MIIRLSEKMVGNRLTAKSPQLKKQTKSRLKHIRTLAFLKKLESEGYYQTTPDNFMYATEEEGVEFMFEGIHYTTDVAEGRSDYLDNFTYIYSMTVVDGRETHRVYGPTNYEDGYEDDTEINSLFDTIYNAAVAYMKRYSGRGGNPDGLDRKQALRLAQTLDYMVKQYKSWDDLTREMDRVGKDASDEMSSRERTYSRQVRPNF